MTADQGREEQKDWSASNIEGKYLTFVLAGEDYGIGILKVREIIGMLPVKTVPQTPDYVKGVVNLRGKVIPVIDLRLKFGLPEKDYGDRTSVIVVDVADSSTTVQIGIIVDAVSEVVNIRGAEIEKAPTFGVRMNTDYILGMAKLNGGVKILLDIDRVLTSDETFLLDNVA